MKTFLIVILAVAVAALATLFYLRTKQVESLSRELENQRKTLDNIAIEHDRTLRRKVRLVAEKPQKITTQYLAMKLSRLLDGFIVVDGDTCFLDVLTPEEKEKK